MTSEGLGEMFEGDSADPCAGKFPLMSMGGRAEVLACADPGVRTQIGASGNFIFSFTLYLHLQVAWKENEEQHEIRKPLENSGNEGPCGNNY